MLKLLKSCFVKTNDCLFLAVPLVVFLSVLGGYFNFAVNYVNSISKLVFAIITFFVMFCGFASSWLYLAKKTIALAGKIYVFDKDRAHDLKELLYTIPKGIGKLFIPVLSVSAFFILVYSLICLCVNCFVTGYAGTINFGEFSPDVFALSTDSFLSTIDRLEPDDIRIIEIWYGLMFVSVLVVTFITFLWIPEIVYEHENSFKALFSSICKVFSNFWEVFTLFVYTAFIVKILSIANTMILIAPVLYFFVLLVTCYFIIYLVVLLFTYYEQKFIKSGE